MKTMTMFNIKNFRLTGIFTCPRCGTPCFSSCCGVTTTSAYAEPELKSEPRKRKRTSQKKEDVNATMADSGMKSEEVSETTPGVPSTTAPTPNQETNVGFSNVNETVEVSYRSGAHFENTVGISSPAADLAHFLSRPIVIHRQTWATSDFTPFSLAAWTLFLENPRVMEKLALYKLIRGTLKIKVVVNGSPFHYGIVFVGMRPWLTTNNTTDLGPDDGGFIRNYTRSGSSDSWQAHRTFYSQRPHVFVDLRTNTEGNITWPMFAPTPFLDLTVANVGNRMGMLEVWVQNSLKMANGGTDPANITFFAWMEDVQLAGIDVFVTATMSDEYAGNGVVSRPATTIARFASRFAGPSFFGRLARATEIGAGAVGSIATLFGFSDPPVIDKQTVISHIQAGKMPNVSGYEPLVKLSLDPKQELSVDPGLLDLPAVDELSFDYIWKREALIAQTGWQTTETDHILGCVVHPALGAVMDNVSFGLVANGQQLTPLSGIARMFEYWRGSMVFRIQIASSQMHRGRLLVTYTPSSDTTVPATPDLNSYYSHVIDISNETDVSFQVNWTQHSAWRRVKPMALGETTAFEVCLGTDRNLAIPEQYANGRIDIWIINRLVAPDPAAFVELNLWVRAGDDFDVMSPVDEWNQYTYSLEGGLYPIPEATMSDINATMADAGYVKDDCEDMPNHDCAVVLNSVASPVDAQALFNAYAGEQIRSVRALMKRWCPYNSYMSALLQDDTYHGVMINQPNFPLGRSLSAYGSSGVDQQANVVSNVFQTYLRHFGQGFAAFKGGVRHMFVANVSFGRPAYHVMRRPNLHDRNITKALVSIASNANATEDYMQGNGGFNPSVQQGPSGIQSFVDTDSSIFMYEVPFYSAHRFVSLHTSTGPGFGDQDAYSTHKVLIDCPTMQYTGTGSEPLQQIRLRQFVSAGEDLQFHFFYGFPPWYFQTARAP